MTDKRISGIITDLRSAISAMEAESQAGRHTGYVNQIEQLHRIIEQLQGQANQGSGSSYGDSGRQLNAAWDEPGSISATGTISAGQDSQKSTTNASRNRTFDSSDSSRSKS